MSTGLATLLRAHTEKGGEKGGGGLGDRRQSQGQAHASHKEKGELVPIRGGGGSLARLAAAG